MADHDEVGAADWDTIWQSELAALAVDRESRERFLLWGQAWIAAGDATGSTSGGLAGADAPPGAAAPGPAFDAEQFERRLRDLVASFGQQRA